MRDGVRDAARGMGRSLDPPWRSRRRRDDDRTGYNVHMHVCLSVTPFAPSKSRGPAGVCDGGRVPRRCLRNEYTERADEPGAVLLRLLYLSVLTLRARGVFALDVWMGEGRGSTGAMGGMLPVLCIRDEIDDAYEPLHHAFRHSKSMWTKKRCRFLPMVLPFTCPSRRIVSLLGIVRHAPSLQPHHHHRGPWSHVERNAPTTCDVTSTARTFLVTTSASRMLPRRRR